MAIIALSGKKNSGKDLVYNIINYLCIKYEFSKIYKYYFSNFNIYLECKKEDKINWLCFQNIKFADKPKDIVCLLIGCTREQLEDREFKEKELGPEWRRWYWSNYKFKSNNNLKGKISSYFNTKEEAKNFLEKFISETTYDISNYSLLENEVLTPRLLIIEIAEFLKYNINSEIWVNSTFSNYLTPHNSLDNNLKMYPNWIITDLRFKNELKAIKDRQGITIRINRYTDNVLINNDTHAVTDWQHPSETELDNETFDIVLDNNGTIEDLIEQVDTKLFKNDIFRNLLL